MRTSKGSSTPGTTSSPTELDVLRALHAPDLPFWSDEPLATLLAARLGATPRAIRPLLDGISLRLDVPGALVGALDETWLFRAREGATAEGVEGAVAWTRIDAPAPYAIVRTFAKDAVEREKRLRALHQRLGARPLAQLHRAPLAAARPSPEDRALLAAARRAPFARLDALAAQARLPARAAKARLEKLVAGRALRVEATPRAGPLAWALVRVAPESAAALASAMAALDGLVESRLPSAGESGLADATLLAPPERWEAMRARALDVPGVASFEIGAPVAAWVDEAALERALSGPSRPGA